MRGRPDVIVLGLARGGVPVGWEIAAALQAPLDVFLVRKLGVPNWPELAMGAIASGGGLVVNDHLIRSLGVTSEQLDAAIRRETDELHRREAPAYQHQDGEAETRCGDLRRREIDRVAPHRRWRDTTRGRSATARRFRHQGNSSVIGRLVV